MLTSGLFFQRAEKELASFSDAAGILVAVSGGPDSMALLRLAHQWATASGRPPLSAATVDHGFREGSADEAAQVAGWCAALGVSHAILNWEGAQPRSRIQERARNMRYGLLARHAAELGHDTLLTAHHADDQAETVLFRLVRGSGVGGLAGMSTVTRRGALRHGRPLLDWRKDELIKVCREAGQGFLTDPSNLDPRYARTRMRRLAGTLAAEGLDAPALARLADRARRADAALDFIAKEARQRLMLSVENRSTIFDAGGAAALPDEILLRLLAIEIARFGNEGPLRLERMERIADDIACAIRNGRAITRNIGGALLAWRPGRGLSIGPEPPRRCGRGN